MDMELEAYLRPPEYPMAPYPAKVVTLATGAKLVIRQAERCVYPTQPRTPVAGPVPGQPSLHHLAPPPPTVGPQNRPPPNCHASTTTRPIAPRPSPRSQSRCPPSPRMAARSSIRKEEASGSGISTSSSPGRFPARRKVVPSGLPIASGSAISRAPRSSRCPPSGGAS